MPTDLTLYSSAFSFTLRSGKEIYPVKMRDRKTGLIAFRVSPGGKRGNTIEHTEQVDEAVMIKRVFEDGYGVRCASLDRKVLGQYKLGHRAVVKVNHGQDALVKFFLDGS